MTLASPPLRQRIAEGAIPRHRHAHGYLAVVLAGGYLEAGDRGRLEARPGDVIVHRPFEAHLNRAPPAGAQVLNLALPDLDLPPFGRLADPDAVARAAARDTREALALIQGQLTPLAAGRQDWPDELACELGRGTCAGLGAWARARGLSPEHLSRGFRKAFGVSPQRFRLEARARAAWRDLRQDSAPLAAVAFDRGFADQAHMSRAVVLVTGQSPRAWRRSIAFKTPA